MTPTSGEPNDITVFQQVLLKAMHETSVLVSTLAGGLIGEIPYENLAKHHACKAAKGIMKAYPGHPFYTTIASFDKVVLHLPKHLRVGEGANEAVELV